MGEAQGQAEAHDLGGKTEAHCGGAENTVGEGEGAGEEGCLEPGGGA
jgi:hypothetical protein